MVGTSRITSRLDCRCVLCGFRGSRQEFYRYLPPPALPSFDDVCPNCHRNDVDVIDPLVEEQVKRQAEEHYALVEGKRQKKAARRDNC